jgi:hypothetical protein
MDILSRRPERAYLDTLDHLTGRPECTAQYLGLPTFDARCFPTSCLTSWIRNWQSEATDSIQPGPKQLSSKLGRLSIESEEVLFPDILLHAFRELIRYSHFHFVEDGPSPEPIAISPEIFDDAG